MVLNVYDSHFRHKCIKLYRLSYLDEEEKDEEHEQVVNDAQGSDNDIDDLENNLLFDLDLVNLTLRTGSRICNRCATSSDSDNFFATSQMILESDVFSITTQNFTNLTVIISTA